MSNQLQKKKRNHTAISNDKLHAGRLLGGGGASQHRRSPVLLHHSGLLFVIHLNHIGHQLRQKSCLSCWIMSRMHWVQLKIK
jgi:hypothetical protein